MLEEFEDELLDPFELLLLDELLELFDELLLEELFEPFDELLLDELPISTTLPSPALAAPSRW